MQKTQLTATRDATTSNGLTPLIQMESSITYAQWLNFVEQRTEDSFYYSQEWLELIATLYGYTFLPLTTTDEHGQLSGILPLYLLQSPLIGKRLVASPFSDQCHLLAKDEMSANALVDHAVRFAQSEKIRYLEIRAGVNQTLAQRTDLVASDDLYVRWVLPLYADPDIMCAKLRPPVQRQIRKSKKLGVQVSFAQQRDEVEHYYHLHLLTRSKKYGMPAQPRRYFYELWDRFAAQNKMKVLLAKYEDKVIAGIVLLASGSVIHYAYGASDANYLHLAAPNLLIWNAIVWGHEHGYKLIDMGRTARANEGLMEYKRRWGAVEEPLPYYYYPGQAGLASTSEESWKYRVLTSVWKKLPLPISGMLGGYMYRHLG